jgi:1-acyl-sn-glycerol-3-phosphate acyltransferase
VFYKLLGIRVQWHGVQYLPAGRHVIVSNHVTVWRAPVHHTCVI